MSPARELEEPIKVNGLNWQVVAVQRLKEEEAVGLSLAGLNPTAEHVWVQQETNSQVVQKGMRDPGVSKRQRRIHRYRE